MAFIDWAKTYLKVLYLELTKTKNIKNYKVSLSLTNINGNDLQESVVNTAIFCGYRRALWQYMDKVWGIPVSESIRKCFHYFWVELVEYNSLLVSFKKLFGWILISWSKIFQHRYKTIRKRNLCRIPNKPN